MARRREEGGEKKKPHCVPIRDSSLAERGFVRACGWEVGVWGRDETEKV